MIEELLGKEPFSLSGREKESVFLKAMKDSLIFHYENCEPYRKFCDNKKFNPNGIFPLTDIPFLPVSIFKELKLTSVPEKDILRNIHSSSTTSGKPSSVYLDRISMNRQVRTMNSIMGSFIGNERFDFIFLDSPETIRSQGGDLSSRATVMRSLLPFSKKAFYILDSNLNLNRRSLEDALNKIEGRVCFYGFTFIIYQFVHNTDKSVSKLFEGIESIVLHSGGWKKLENIKVEKKEFNRRVSEFLITKPENVIDIYGMVEHLGVLYPDCKYGYKHVPVFSDVIIRDTHTLEPVENGKSGFIQLLSPIPHSYPGVSIISDDIGKIVMDDGCRCGRKGKAFLFESRAKEAEVRGCGDTLKGPE